MALSTRLWVYVWSLGFKVNGRGRRDLDRVRFGWVTFCLVITTLALAAPEAWALIMGDVGNKPVTDPGWPKGAAAIFNQTNRIAWWEGPPLGGGQWHAEYRGDAKALTGILANFANLDVKSKKVILHDGVGTSFWLNPNRMPAKAVDARMDWEFMVWQPERWERLRGLPADLNPTGGTDPNAIPPSHLDVYTGGNVRWADVKVPKGLEVVDQRMEAHGFTVADGRVLEGKIMNLSDSKPVAGRMRLQRVEPQPKGGYRYVNVAEAVADAQGRWVLKHAPAGWNRILVEAQNYVPRVLAYVQFDDQPAWASYEGGLAPAGPVSGRVTDDEGNPLADVDVRIHDVAVGTGGRYESTEEYATKTDAAGVFQVKQIPIGRANVWIHKPGYCRPGLGRQITMPSKNVTLQMIKAAEIRFTVDFTGKARPDGYMVEMEPEEGAGVGRWSGSGNIDAENKLTFQNVPPGAYLVRGHPNPTSEAQKTAPVKVELKGGSTTELTIVPK